MPREAREIWTPAKRSIVGEWRDWAKKHPEMSKSESAFGAFYVHLQKNSRELLTFAADNHFETVRGWLAEENLIRN
ncbi:MAG TPA: hypothetical protein VGQ63_11905 [Pseudolabrys sp.]|jgi:hypothetical protein|nr:hypothetical protein [Pseudolabrys sp.]